jgi:MFS family permease
VALYALDSLTFVVAVALFAGLRVPPADREQGKGTEQTYLGDLLAGIGFVRGTVIAHLIGASLMANALLGITWAVLPAFADVIGGADTYGFLLAGISGGTLLGALLAGRFDGVPYGRLAIGGFGVAAVAWFGAIQLPWFVATVALLGVAFVPVGITNVVASTMLQRLVPDSLLGRVMALLGSMGTAAVPLGSLLGGVAGDVYGPVAVMQVGALGFLWIVAYVALLPSLRRLPAPIDVEELSGGDPGPVAY